jgi:hypothetical protein
MIKSALVFALLTAGCVIYAQNNDCKVNVSGLAGSYTGGCKNGLAHGKGIAQGTDHYEGQFNKGLPDGKGTYRWASGVFYEGEWKNGLREGQGKMVYPDSVVTGYWKGDQYLGKKPVAPYKIITSISVARYTISKSADKMYGVKLRIMQGGLDNISIEDFSMAYDNGHEYKNGYYYGIENEKFPMSLKIKYRSWNQLMTSQYNVIFEVEIFEPGCWNIVLNN